MPLAFASTSSVSTFIFVQVSITFFTRSGISSLSCHAAMSMTRGTLSGLWSRSWLMRTPSSKRDASSATFLRLLRALTKLSARLLMSPEKMPQIVRAE